MASITKSLHDDKSSVAAQEFVTTARFKGINVALKMVQSYNIVIARQDMIELTAVS